MASQKIRIRLKGYDHEIVDQSTQPHRRYRPEDGCQGFRSYPAADGAQPVLRRQWARTSNKDSREQFEMRTHKRLIDILEPTPNTVDSLMRLDLPAGVDIEIKL